MPRERVATSGGASGCFHMGSDRVLIRESFVVSSIGERHFEGGYNRARAQKARGIPIPAWLSLESYRCTVALWT